MSERYKLIIAGTRSLTIRQMAEYADAAIVFWDGKSRGTQNMIQQMRELGKPVEVVIYPKEEK